MTTTGILATATAALAIVSTAVEAQDVRTGYIDANGVNYYYEIHGQGEPLLLLHGGLGSIEMFGPIMPALAEGRQVIAVDLHGHGRTTLGDRQISLIGMGDDMAVILEQLGYDQVDVLGYSLGGGVAFRLAVQHPEHGAPAGAGLRRLRAGRLLSPRCCRSRRRSARRWPT